MYPEEAANKPAISEALNKAVVFCKPGTLNNALDNGGPNKYSPPPVIKKVHAYGAI